MRDFAAQQGVDEQTALSKGMEQKAVEFVKQGRAVSCIARLDFLICVAG